MPWMVIAPTIKRHDRIRRNAQCQQRNERSLRRGVVGCFRRCHTPDLAAAETFGVLRNALLERIGGERGHNSAAPRQDTKDRSENGTARDRAGRVDQVLPRRHQALDLAFTMSRLSCDISRLRMISAKAKNTHGDVGEADTVGQLGDIEGHAARARLKVGPDHRQQQTGQDHGDGVEDRTFRQYNREDEAEHHQREIFRRTEEQRE